MKFVIRCILFLCWVIFFGKWYRFYVFCIVIGVVGDLVFVENGFNGFSVVEVVVGGIFVILICMY